MNHKAGFVNIIGNPNVGKSTLMNALVGEKLSIITSKAQTTRNRILGFVNADDFQIIYSDTPGIVNPSYKLHEAMLNYVNEAIDDADVLLYVVEAENKEEKNEHIAQKLQNTENPLIIIINKIDLLTPPQLDELFDFWITKYPKATILPVSALRKLNVDQVFKAILHFLPESPAYFPKDELTDKTMRFFVSEIIREKIFLTYDKEVPYACQVDVESYIESDNLVKINAVIYVERDTQKGILIGHKGAGLKTVGTKARYDIEDFIDKHVHLELFVKVKKDWKNDEKTLKRFGY